MTSFTVDIPAFVGGDTGFAGFTAGTGGAFVLTDVTTWTYNEQEENLVPRAPTNVRITSVDRHDHNRSNVTIAWNCNNAYTAQVFLLQRSTDGINFRALAAVDTGTTTFTDERLRGGTYYYRIESFNDAGLSRPSNVDSVLLGGGDFGVSIDHSAGFTSHGDLTRNGPASFSPD